MASSIPFDTLAYAKKLISAGVPQAQAEIQAEAFAEIIEDKLVTKQYLDIKLKELEMRLTLSLGGVMAAGVAIVATLVKIL